MLTLVFLPSQLSLNLDLRRNMIIFISPFVLQMTSKYLFQGKRRDFPFSCVFRQALWDKEEETEDEVLDKSFYFRIIVFIFSYHFRSQYDNMIIHDVRDERKSNNNMIRHQKFHLVSCNIILSGDGHYARCILCCGECYVTLLYYR